MHWSCQACYFIKRKKQKERKREKKIKIYRIKIEDNGIPLRPSNKNWTNPSIIFVQACRFYRGVEGRIQSTESLVSTKFTRKLAGVPRIYVLTLPWNGSGRVQRRNITNRERRFCWNSEHDDLSAKKIIREVGESVLVSKGKFALSFSLSELFLISLCFYVLQTEVAGELQSLIMFVRLINDRAITNLWMCIGKLDSIGWRRWISSFYILTRSNRFSFASTVDCTVERFVFLCF